MTITTTLGRKWKKAQRFAQRQAARHAQGVCPYCHMHMTASALAQHVESKHPSVPQRQDTAA